MVSPKLQKFGTFFGGIRFSGGQIGCNSEGNNAVDKKGLKPASLPEGGVLKKKQ